MPLKETHHYFSTSSSEKKATCTVLVSKDAGVLFIDLLYLPSRICSFIPPPSER